MDTSFIDYTTYLLYHIEKEKFINNKPKYHYTHNLFVADIKDAMHFKTMEDARKAIKYMKEETKEYQIVTCEIKIVSEETLK